MSGRCAIISVALIGHCLCPMGEVPPVHFEDRRRALQRGQKAKVSSQPGAFGSRSPVRMCSLILAPLSHIATTELSLFQPDPGIWRLHIFIIPPLGKRVCNRWAASRRETSVKLFCSVPVHHGCKREYEAGECTKGYGACAQATYIVILGLSTPEQGRNPATSATDLFASTTGSITHTHSQSGLARP